jgi:hypothetical protein
VTVHKGSFVAEDDIGDRYVIHMFQEIDDISHVPIEGLISLKTIHGRHVNRITKGKYEIVDFDTPLESNDPYAP